MAWQTRAGCLVVVMGPLNILTDGRTILTDFCVVCFQKVSREKLVYHDSLSLSLSLELELLKEFYFNKGLGWNTWHPKVEQEFWV
jgi:hypothetical protein